jgi:hypothetical protein
MNICIFISSTSYFFPTGNAPLSITYHNENTIFTRNARGTIILLAYIVTLSSLRYIVKQVLFYLQLYRMASTLMDGVSYIQSYNGPSK